MSPRGIGKGSMLAASNAGGAFAPTDIADLQVWFDASDESSIATSGTTVTQWDDKSGNANHLSSIVGSPQSGTRTVNSLNVVDLTPNSALYRNSVPLAGSSSRAWTLFAVAVFDTLGSIQLVVDGDDSTGGSRVGQYLRNNSANLETIGFAGFGAVSSSVGGLTTGTPLLLRSLNRDNGGSRTLTAYRDGTAGSTTGTFTQNYDSTQRLTIGARFAGQNFLNGAVCEVVSYNVELSAGDITSVEDYLSAKWGTA